jgi:hypothetical protein
MKPNHFFRTACVLAVLTGALLVAGVMPATAADNTATGDIAGAGAALTDSNTVSLTATAAALALYKRAFLADGTALTSGTTIPKGTLVKFMIYVDNYTAVPVVNMNVGDVLDVTATGFTYSAGSIKVDNTVANCAAGDGTCTALEEAAIFAAIDDNAALDDGLDATDVAGFNTTDTISAGAGTGNLQLDVAASRVWAILFSVTIN